MLRQLFLSIFIVSTLIIIAPLTVSADCKDEILEVRDDIDKNNQKYTKEAILKARKYLLQAEVPSLRPVEYRRKVLAAKKELLRGKK